MIFLEERISQLVKELSELRYPKELKIPRYRMKKTEEKFADVANLDTSAWEVFDCSQLWGGHREYYWFDAEVVIPEDFAGCKVVYSITTGREGLWDATNPQFSFYLDGKLIQGLDVNHREVPVADCAKAGEKHRITLSAFSGDQNFSLVLNTSLKVLDTATETYYYDVSVPYHVAAMLEREDAAYIEIIRSLNESLNLLDLRKPYSEEYYRTLGFAQEFITKEFYETLCGDSEASVYCVGHTHIDVAWLWTLAVTRDKSVRSFSTVLELMREFPEYIFMSSQAQLYRYVQEEAPQLYEEIKQRVREGRWETEGAMYLEADCNLSSGESLVRQFLHGKRFFLKEFNQDHKILWLPDVFGYSAALPQIMQKSGVPWFMTTKISWNEFNKLPYDTFLWEGIDGSKVLTHFIPSRDYNKKAERGSYESEHFTTYNGTLGPSQIKGAWQRYQQKYLNREVLMSFGYGDGGGGPTKEMLENQRRLAKGIPGCPKTVMATAGQFYEKLERDVSDDKYLPTWTGELYLEYHRGTYTSMARNKKYNRRSEFLLQNAETYSVLANRLAGKAYPKQELYDGWDVILRNQFHDILPGSSIKEVYEDSKEEYEKLAAAGNRLVDDALASLSAAVNASKGDVVVYNPLGFECSEIVSFPVPEGCANPAVYDGEACLPIQKLADGSAIFRAKNVPSKGYKTFSLKDEACAASGTVRIAADAIDTPYYSISLNSKGQFASIYDKTAKRELLKKGECGNVLMSYEDKPHNYDAWDVNNYYKEKSWEIDNLESAVVTENGPVRSSLSLTWKYLDSKITQIISVYPDDPRIDVRNEIDWNEKQIFVKSLFPVDIHTSEASFEIQYGNVTRQTHYNTMWDFARFEVCMHKWMDVSEDGYGVSMLNDCKYGCSVHDGVIGLSLLKSAVYPNPDADKEHHSFTFSIYPHTGSWRDAETPRQAYRLNDPPVAVVKPNDGGSAAACYSLVSCDQPNIMIEVAKEAEDSGELIVRLYECHNRRTETALTFGNKIVKAAECDLLERDINEMSPEGNAIRFTVKPYEIKTFKVSLEA